MLLEKGVNLVTTLEYSDIESQHPNITTITAKTLRKLYLDGDFSNNKKFDAAITFSSVEHSGLGRYFYGGYRTLAPIMIYIRIHDQWNKSYAFLSGTEMQSIPGET